MSKKIIFLGYRKNRTSLISFLRKKKNIVYEFGNKIIKTNDVEKADLIISFGYKHIINQNILNIVKRPIINLHISYLPFNRGSHPVFWSFVENTPKGVSIHEIDKEIDLGNIIFRKKYIFKKKNLTFQEAYLMLICEIEKLFKKKYNQIITKKYRPRKINSLGTFHKDSDLPSSLVSWNIKISKYVKDHDNRFSK